ncbi:type II toxin-antitoxin system RelE/ParE family toxin [Arcobacter sp. FWKO B]|uniref:type II toxin-antitoxin system RelE/ParE family toxin n=1 Tax=Arcobacter sp. FWKO B TaxID=2593672 RepID=UPI0018A39BCD|nr:type II toxin-antitoxin system RelE/ParE family toxin [Arcobacter sp. FWKO B]QOG12690.1 type II toxin-antitoxin system RelE/ParE family toxin [Arcobacter sp. FWKO B]
MKINFSNRFEKEFFEIYMYIAKDSFSNADNFKSELMSSMQILKDFPYMYRKSKKAKYKNLRNMIYKKYVIPYKIKENEILILGIFKKNLWKA